MKTAVSIPDTLFREAERLAARQKKSRSRLYADALALYLSRHDPEATTEAMNRVADSIDTRADAFIRHAASRVLHRSEW